MITIKTSTAVIGFLTALLLSVAAVTTFVSAQGNDMVYSCVNNNSGTIKIVAPNISCQNNEIPLNWSKSSSVGGISGLVAVSSQGPLIAPEGGLQKPGDPSVTGRWTQSVTCPPGKIALGGGGEISDANGNSDGYGNSLTNSYPVGNPPAGWTVSMAVLDGVPVSLTAYATCANGPS